MARGWGRNEEDLAAEKEAGREERNAPAAARREDSDRIVRRRSLEMTLARIEEQLAVTTNPVRRRALESARDDLIRRGLSG